MRGLAPHAPQNVGQSAFRPLWRSLSLRSRQQCFAGHTTATAFLQPQQQHLADVVARDCGALEGSAANQAAQEGHPLSCEASSCSTPADPSSQAGCQDAQKALQAWQSVSTEPEVPPPPPQQQQQHVAVPQRQQLPQESAGSEADQQAAQQLPANGNHQPRQPHEQQQNSELRGCVQQDTVQDTESDADADAGLEYQQNICRSLRVENCSSVEQLAAILSEHGPYMDGQALTASYTSAARLGKQLQQQQQQELPQTQQSAASNSRQRAQYQLVQLLEQQLLPLLRAKLRQLDAVGLQLVLFSLASLQYKQEVVVLEMEVALTPIIHHLPPGRLCQLVWSLGQLGVRPNGQLVKSMFRGSSRCMSFLQGQDLCQLLQGLVLLKLQPHMLWLEACCARVLQLCAHQRLQPRALCSILHNLACLLSSQQQQQQVQSQQPSLSQQQEQSGVPRTAAGLPQPLLQQLLAATQQVLKDAASGASSSADSQQSAGVLQQQDWDVQRLQQEQQVHQQVHQLEQYHLQQQQQQASCDAMQANVTRAQQQGVCDWDQQQSLGSQSSEAVGAQPMLQQLPIWQQQHREQHLGRLHEQPAPSAQQQQYHHHQQQLTPAGLVTLANSLRRLKSDPPKAWQAAYVAAAAQLMHRRDARNVPLMLAPCVRWRQSPGHDWLQQYLAACQGLMPAMHRQGLAVLGHSLTALQVQPPPAWLLAYLRAADSTHLASTPAGCSYLMHTLGAWTQLGCLHQHQTPQPQPAGLPAMHQAVPASTASSSSLHAPSRGGAASSGQGQNAMAAAAGQQLQGMAQSLAGQCIRCFMDHGHSFTAEQLGMFCKGLAQWGMRGTPQLANRLEQVVLQQLSQQPSRRRRRTVPKQRVTAATLCSILLALAVACPDAATPSLLSALWTSWSSWLVPMTTPAHAAGAAWAMGRLGVQPPQDLAQGLLQQLVMAAGDWQLQHLATVLLEARRGGWQVEPQQVWMALAAMLEKQAAELSGVQVQLGAQGGQQLGVGGEDRAGAAQAADDLQGRYAQQSRMHGGDSGPSGSNPVGFALNESEGGGGSSSVAAARLYGLANHRLKGWVMAAAAAAAWCDLMPFQTSQAAVQMYSRCVGVLSAEQQGAVEAHLRVMQASCRQRGSSGFDQLGQ